MAAIADVSGFGRPLVEVILLVVAPVFFPCAWIGGAVLLLMRKGGRKGSVLTLALCPAGLIVPLWFYGAGTDPPTLAAAIAFPIAALLLATNLVAVWRILAE